MIPRVGEPPLRTVQYTLRPGAYAILRRGASVLLTVQTDDIMDVQLPGGGVDPGESLLQALHREVWEETGWTIARPRRVGAFRRFVYMPEYDLWGEKLCHVFQAHPARQIDKPQEPEHMNIWMKGSDAVVALGNDGDRMFLKQILRGP